MKPMRDPVRLSAEPALRAVLESAALDDDDAALARVAASLAAAGAITTVAAGAAGVSAGAVPGATAGAATTVGAAGSAGAGVALGAKVTVVMLALATVGTLAVVTRAPTAHSPQVQPPASSAPRATPATGPAPPRPVDTQAPATPSPAEPIAPIVTIRESPPSRRVAPPALPEATPTLAEEMALVARMRESVDVDPSETLRLAAEHRARFGLGARFARDCERYEALAREALADEATATDQSRRP